MRQRSFGTLRDFVTTPPVEGLGTDAATVRSLLHDYREELALFDVAIARGPGGQPGNQNAVESERVAEVKEEPGTNPDIVRIRSEAPRDRVEEPPAGNSREYAHRRLNRERPDLLEKVKAKELTANAAMIEAGFRKKETPLGILRREWRKASPEERAVFLAEIGEDAL